MLVVPVAELPDSGFTAALELVQACEQATDPEVPPVTSEEFRRLVTDDRTEANVHVRTAVVDGGRVRAVGHLELETDDANRHLATSEVFGAALDPEAGRAALANQLDLAEADGRTSLLGWGPLDDAEDRFWTGSGATRRYSEQLSVLHLADVDPDLMAAWIDRRHERAGDLELVVWSGSCPDPHLDAMAISGSAMSDAPTEGVEINPVELDRDDVRETEDARRALGLVGVTILAVDPGGAPAGHTTVIVNPFRPDASWQWDTVVLPAHRRRGVGRWLKAEMWRHLRATHPEVGRLATGNAGTNEAMLAINTEMGYRPTVRYGAWQAEIATYRATLRSGRAS